jgi:hypothetical protein
LNGGACLSPGSNCVNAGTDASVQANLVAEQNKINHNLNPFKYYPVLALTFGYRF